MEYISSDTNVWIDFYIIDRLYLPFRLRFTYVMYKESIINELLSPADLPEKLISFGLKPIDINTQEAILAMQYQKDYRKLTYPDRIALAIAKNRNIPLMTGDKDLRKAAQKEKVQLIGTIGIVDLLHEYNYLDINEYLEVLRDFSNANKNNVQVRLPQKELDLRIKNAVREIENQQIITDDFER